MTVAELIEFLKTQPQDLLVCYSQYSEYALVEPGYIGVIELGECRPDGWVPDKRPDKPTQRYLFLP